MTVNDSRRSRRLIGRADELQRLSQAADEAARGAGGCVLIEGEAGIGKTRLVAELRAEFEGYVLEGRCYEEDRSIPFAPLQGALNRLLAAASPDEAPLFARHAGSLGTLVSGLADVRPEQTRGDGDDPAARQRRLFEAAAELVFDLAARQPLLLVFEDLHWSDEGTLAFVRFLVRHLEGHRAFVIATYRASELPAPLADLVLTLRRAQLTQWIVLEPLARGEIAALLELCFGGAPVGSDVVDAVAAFSAGNPFYVEELAADMARAGAVYLANGVWTRKLARELRVPKSIQDAVQRRGAELTPEAKRLLQAAAIAGRDFGFELVAAIAGLPENELVARLKELVAAGFIVEERPDAFTFRHPLLQEAARAELLGRERRSLHGQVARALEQIHSTESAPLAELAYHYYAAGEWERALPLARLAGEQAQRLDATREALAEYTRALDCALQLKQKPPPDLLLARAELFERVGEFAAAEGDLSAALQAAEQTGHRREVWRALLKLGYLWSARDYARSLAWFERALDAAEALEDPLAQAETLNRIGNVHLNLDEPDRALPYHEAALAAFASARNPAGQAGTLELMGVCYYNLPDVLAGAACEEQALTLARTADERSVVFHAAIHLLLPLRFETEVGPPLEAERLAGLGEEALGLARTMGWLGGEAQALGLLGGFYGLLGEYGRGLAYLDDSLRLARRLEHVAGIGASERMIAAILIELMAYDEAVDRLRSAWDQAQQAGARFFGDIAAAALCQALVARSRADDLAEAERLVGGLLTGATRAGGRIERETLCVRAEIELAAGQAQEALATLEALLVSTPHLESLGLAAVPRLALLLGRVYAMLGRTDDAARALDAAVDGARSQGRRGLLWRAHAELGRLRLICEAAEDRAG